MRPRDNSAENLHSGLYFVYVAAGHYSSRSTVGTPDRHQAAVVTYPGHTESRLDQSYWVRQKGRHQYAAGGSGRCSRTNYLSQGGKKILDNSDLYLDDWSYHYFSKDLDAYPKCRLPIAGANEWLHVEH